MQLTPAEEQEYIFLRRQVDYYQDLRFSRDAPPDVSYKWQRARDELRDFVSEKRRIGRTI